MNQDNYRFEKDYDGFSPNAPMVYITLLITGKKYRINFDSRTKVCDMKEKISFVTGIQYDYRLVFEEKQLDDGKFLVDYNIYNKSSIVLVLRLRGNDFQNEKLKGFKDDAPDYKISKNLPLNIEESCKNRNCTVIMSLDEYLLLYDYDGFSPNSPFVYIKNDKYYRINIDSRTTVDHLKEKIQIVTGHPADDLRLIFEGKQLDDGKFLGDYNIQNKSLIYFNLRQYGGGGYAKNIKFNDFQNEKLKGFKDDAPDYRIINKGLNIEATCYNKNCTAFKKRVWVQKGFGTFNINTECYNSLCPLCKHDTQDANNSGFYLCKYTIEGKLRNNDGSIEKFSQSKKADLKDNFVTFEEDGHEVDWLYLNIKTEEL